MIKVMNNLYTNRKLDWLNEIEENDFAAMPIQRWLSHNDAIRVQVRWLDKYVFALPTKMYLSLAWSVIPKVGRMPYPTDKLTNEQLENENFNIFLESEEQEYKFLFDKIRKHFELSDNDFNSIKPYLLKDIKKNTADWFKFYGIEKKMWKKFHLNFDDMKKGAMKEKAINSLNSWGF